MPQNFLSCDRDQVLLLPPDLRDWLPAGHLARFVIETVDELDLGVIYGYYREDGHGRPAHDPAMMVALVLYSYACGVTSSRKIERRCVEDVATRVVTANRKPDHATIANFLVRHRGPLSELFFQLLALCKRAGMVKVGSVAVDSTKLAANASPAQNRTYEGLREEARRIVEEAIETDAREDVLYGEARGDELPEELADPRTRKARIRELLDQAEREREQVEAERAAIVAREAERQAAPGGSRRAGARPGAGLSAKQRKRLSKKYNLTDPDSRVVRHRGMLMQGYNVQTVVGEGQIILAIEAGHQAVDQGQLKPTIEQLQANLARLGLTDSPREVLADSGYWSAPHVTELQRQKMRVLLPPNKGTAKNCDRLGSVAREMLQTLSSEAGGQAYKRRVALIEPVFADIKHNRGITRLLRRGRQAVQAELDLIAATHNLRKLHRHALATG
jgi:transposase